MKIFSKSNLSHFLSMHMATMMGASKLFLGLFFVLSIEESCGSQARPGYVQIGDMFLPISNGTTRNAVVYEHKLWPNGRIPFVIHDSLDKEKAEIIKAIEDIHSVTCIRFTPRVKDPGYVRFRGDGLGCVSYVGRVGGTQDLILQQGCISHGIILHEMLHSIGFYHEHQRSDRDEHITIHWENIYKGTESQFEKLAPFQNKLINGYNPQSIMHYGETAFSKDGYNKTMTHNGGQPLYDPYLKPKLTQSDIRRVNILYNC